ncbi:hypothetical protein VDIAB_30157 [Vibrio diabolicus]|nr:hypothetical protein VDIAB_30157 [Vibrio diabolicus]
MHILLYNVRESHHSPYSDVSVTSDQSIASIETVSHAFNRRH